MIDLSAPIIPFESMGGIKLYQTIKDLKPILEQRNVKEAFVYKFVVSYEIENQISLWFNLLNGKLYKIIALKDYTGVLLDKIRIGMHINEVLEIEPSFVYEDFEEVYVSDKGIYIETDPETNNVLWVSVFVKEIDDIDFEEGNW